MDTSNGQSRYVSREIVNTCVERIVFMNADSLVQYDSCSGQSPVIRTGNWIWYLPDGFLFAEIFTDSSDQSHKGMYNYTGDTLQFQIAPALALDSAYTKFYLRIRTYTF